MEPKKNEAPAELLSRLWRHARSAVYTLEPADVEAIALVVEGLMAELATAQASAARASAIVEGAMRERDDARKRLATAVEALRGVLATSWQGEHGAPPTTLADMEASQKALALATEVLGWNS